VTDSAVLDVAIVGAGAAGIAAARRLTGHGLSCRVFEARSRPGGRAWTETASLGVALDRGCAWLHDATNNPLRPFAEQAGLGGPTDIPIRTHHNGTFASATANEEAERRVEAGLKQIAEDARQSPDQPASRLLDTAGRQDGVLHYVLTAISGEEPEAYSSGDAAHEDALESNWLVKGGLGRLISDDLAAGIPASFATPVHRVHHSRSPIVLDTAAGSVRTRAVIVTAPPSVLAQGRPTFLPGLPAWKTAAFEAVGMGSAEKLALAFHGQPFGRDEPHFLTIDRHGGLMGFHIEPGPPAVAVAYTGGALARGLAAMAPKEAINEALAFLVHAYGENLQRQLSASTVTRWQHDAWSLGSYSAARPGSHHERLNLAAPVTDRLRFAGEATHEQAFATAHGAWLSGCREADALARVLKAPGLAVHPDAG